MILEAVLGQAAETESAAMELFSKLVDNSVAVALSVTALWLAYKAACTLTRWMAAEVVVPVRDRAFAHLDKTNNALDRLSDTLDAMCETMDRRSGEDRTAEEKRHAEASQKLDRIHDKVIDIERHVIAPPHRASMEQGK